MPVASDIQETLAHLSDAIEHYCSSKLDASKQMYKERRLPGQFLDQQGVMSDQSGIAGIYLLTGVFNLLDHRLKPRSSAMKKLCSDVAAITVSSDKNLESNFKGVDWKDFKSDHHRITVKRCAYVLGLPPSELVKEIAFILSSTKNGHLVSCIPVILDDPTSQRHEVITAYVLSCILDAMESVALKFEGLDDETRKTIDHLYILLKSYATNPNSQTSAVSPIHRLIALNAAYRIQKLKKLSTSEVEEKNEAGKQQKTLIKYIKSQVQLVYDNSTFDPFYVGTELIHFYSDGGSAPSESIRDRYFRISADVVLIEAFIYLYREDLGAFEKGRTQLLLSKVLRPYRSQQLNGDASNQRLTCYSLYHTMSVISKLERLVLPNYSNVTTLEKAIKLLRRTKTTWSVFSESTYEKLVWRGAAYTITVAVLYLSSGLVVALTGCVILFYNLFEADVLIPNRTIKKMTP